MADDRLNSIKGSLLGTAVGDAIGLCCEGMSRRRLRKMFGQVDSYHFIFGRGMVSDDTEHTAMVAQAMIVSAGEPKRFTRSLAWRLRLWFWGLPAGIGLATLRSILKLWVGFPGTKSGVFSAGNGPAMRAPIIGVCYGHDLDKMRALVKASTRITHTDLKAEFASLAVALAANMASEAKEKRISPQEFMGKLKNLLDGNDAGEFLDLIRKVVVSVEAGKSTESFADEIGQEKGVTGYIYDTVPVAIHSWLTHQDNLRDAIVETVGLGGDTDTVAAILGGIVGAGVGRNGIPTDWLDKLWEWPRSVKWLEGLAEKLANTVETGKPGKTQKLFPPAVFLRNMFFMVVVLLHGFRRLLPPY